MALRLFDQANELRQPRRGTGFAYAQARRAFPTDRPGEHRIAGRLVHRLRLAGQQRFLETGVLVEQPAISRHRLADRHADDVAGGERTERNGFERTVGAFARGEHRPGARQGVDLCRGKTADAVFQSARQQQQEHEHRRGVVPDVGAATNRFHQAGEIGQQGGSRDQRVHAQTTLLQLAPATLQEGPAG